MNRSNSLRPTVPNFILKRMLIPCKEHDEAVLKVLCIQYAEGDDPPVNETHVETSPGRVQTHPARLLRPVLVAPNDVPHVDEVGTEQLDPVVVAIQDEDVSEWIGSEADGGVHASRPGPIGAAVGARRASH